MSASDISVRALYARMARMALDLDDVLFEFMAADLDYYQADSLMGVVEDVERGVEAVLDVLHRAMALDGRQQARDRTIDLELIAARLHDRGGFGPAPAAGREESAVAFAHRTFGAAA
jgi:hypothetical protein